MSFTSLKSSFFDTCPKIWADKDYLYARTSIFYRFLNLFSYSRTVVVDRIKKHIEIKVKKFWFFTSKKYIPFNDIDYTDMERREKDGMFAVTQTKGLTETWYVQIIRKNSEEPENLFRFIGDGGADNYYSNLFNNLPFIKFSGRQYENALLYAELVSKYTGAHLFKDTKIEYNVKVEHYKCLKCGHVSPSKIKCMYCGSQEMEKMS